jgi:hypothetical protein
MNSTDAMDVVAPRYELAAELAGHEADVRSLAQLIRLPSASDDDAAAASAADRVISLFSSTGARCMRSAGRWSGDGLARSHSARVVGAGVVNQPHLVGPPALRVHRHRSPSRQVRLLPLSLAFLGEALLVGPRTTPLLLTSRRNVADVACAALSSRREVWHRVATMG